LEGFLSLLPKLILFEILKKEVSFWKLFLMRSKLSLSPELLINFRSELLMRVGFLFRFALFSKRGEERNQLQQLNGCVLGESEVKRRSTGRNSLV
jgi:hypothetical protein